jgi:hypothetical protein
MKKSIFILLVALCASFAAQAQSYTIDSLASKHKETKTTAIVLAVTGPITLGSGAGLIALGVYSKQPAASLGFMVGGSVAIGLGLFETIYAFVLADRADKQKEALIKLRSGAAMHISYPVPVMVAGRAPGIGFSVRF